MSPILVENSTADTPYGCVLLRKIRGYEKRRQFCLHCPLYEEYGFEICLEERKVNEVLPPDLKRAIDEIKKKLSS